MSENSKIEWTDASWNVTAGCTAVSSGCAHCYAASMTRRLQAIGIAGYADLTNDRHFNGTVRCLPQKLGIPLRWKKPRRIFVNSMSDLFHKDVPFEFIDKVFAVMSMSEHTFQILTKRPERAADYFSDPIARQAAWAYQAIKTLNREDYGQLPCFPLPNVWIGTSIENQAAADKRIPELFKIPAKLLFVSNEPSLGPVDWQKWYPHPIHGKCRPMEQIGWFICGGESGPHARPMHPDWPNDLRDQCASAGIPFFFKQWGEWEPMVNADCYADFICDESEDGDVANMTKNVAILWPDGTCERTEPKREWWHVWRQSNWEKIESMGDSVPVAMHRVGKAVAGREFQGREYNEFPEVSR